MEHMLPLEQYSALQDSYQVTFYQGIYPVISLPWLTFNSSLLKKHLSWIFLNFLLIVNMSLFWLKNNMAKRNFYKLTSINDNPTNSGRQN